MMSTTPLELWGGVECSLVRIGDDYRNQVVETGHSARLQDIDAIAELGVKAVRYPILWETVGCIGEYALGPFMMALERQ